MAANQDVQAILAALQGESTTSFNTNARTTLIHTTAQQPAAPPTNTVQPPPPLPAYSGVVPTPPPQQGGYPPYPLPQPAASGSIDLNAIKPVGHGNVNFQDA